MTTISRLGPSMEIQRYIGTYWIFFGNWTFFSEKLRYLSLLDESARDSHDDGHEKRSILKVSTVAPKESLKTKYVVLAIWVGILTCFHCSSKIRHICP